MSKVNFLRHYYATNVCPMLEEYLAKEIGIKVVDDGSKGKLLLYIVYPIGVRLDSDIEVKMQEKEEKYGIPVKLIILRYGDNEHLQPASISQSLMKNSVQIAFNNSGPVKLPMTIEALTSLKNWIN